MAAQGQDATLAASLGGMGPGSGSAAGPGMAPPAPGGDTQGGGDTQDVVDLIRQMLDAAQAYLQMSTDEEDNAVMAKMIPALQALLAKDQKDLEQASQGTITPRLQRKMPATAAAPPPGQAAADMLTGGGGG